MQQASLPQGKRKAKFIIMPSKTTLVVSKSSKWVLLLKFLLNRASTLQPSCANCKKTMKSIGPALKVVTCTCKLAGCKISPTSRLRYRLFNHINTSSWIRMPSCMLTKLPCNLIITKTALSYLLGTQHPISKIDPIKVSSNRSQAGRTSNSCRLSFRTTQQLSFRLKYSLCMRSTVRLVNKQTQRKQPPRIQKSSRVEQLK